MANIKGIHISGHHVVAINSICLFIYICNTLFSKRLKGRTESYFVLFFKLNDHPKRCFNFGLLR